MATGSWPLWSNAWAIGASLLAAAAVMAVRSRSRSRSRSFGFWWFAGLSATHEAYYALGLDRPFYYFVLNTFSALALVVGPAVAAGLAVNRDRRLWMLVGGAAAAVIVADLTGLSTGEVERIWLPFAIWLLPVGAVLFRGSRSVRVWLALQALCPIVVVALIRTYW